MVRVPAQDRDPAARVNGRGLQNQISERATAEPGETAVICGTTAVPTHLGERRHMRQDDYLLERSSCLVEQGLELEGGAVPQLHELSLKLGSVLQHSEGIVDTGGALQV